MNKIELWVDKIEDFLKEKINDPKAVFIFSTDVVAQTWADWCVMNNHTAKKSVALNRFITWDDFKRDFLSKKQQDATTVPAILRKLFVYDLIKRNSDGDKRIFKTIINPDYADTAYSFSDWIGRSLPSLQLWKNRMEKNAEEYGELDEEDLDFLELYKEYKQFLEKNNLFEPSWIDASELCLKDKNHDFYIFYPEQLADFGDFDAIFSINNEAEENEKNPSVNVTALVAPKKDITLPKVYCYSDARKELRQTMLRIIELVKNNKADWTEISLNIPDIETYRPYLERELEQYGIPYVIRAGISLTKNSAGRIFKEIYQCYNSDYSFDSVRALLLDECIPWKKEITFNMAKKGEDELYKSFDFDELREALIREGNRMRCLCSFEEKNADKEKDPTAAEYVKVDVWQEALLQNYNKEESRVLLKLYDKLKTAIKSFFNPFEKEVSFATIQEAWFAFKTDFINDQDFSSDANRILSRCITHLQEIISIEEQYLEKTELQIASPYEFFLKELDSKKYTPQSNKKGISVFPYKVSAGAYFKYQFVVDSSQKSLDVPYKKLAFLNANKRSKLKLLEDDKLFNSTQSVILLYGKKISEVQEDFVTFSFSEDAFSGFSIPHSFLEMVDEEDCPNLNDQDFIWNENFWLEKGGKEKITLSPLQKQQLENWMKTALLESNENQYLTGEALEQRIQYLMIDSKDKKVPENSPERGKIRISPRGDMEKFFPCARKWVFSNLLKLKDESLDTELMSVYDMGNLNHKVLEDFMQQYSKKYGKLPFYDESNDAFMQQSSVSDSGVINAQAQDVTDKIRDMLFGYENEEQKNPGIVSQVLKNGRFDFSDSPIVIKTLLAHEQQIGETVFNCLKKLLLPYNENAYSGINGIGNCTVEGIEKSYSRVEGDFVYNGKIDCVIKTTDNKLLILDYKNTGSSFPEKSDFLVDEETSILGDYQIPVYCYLLCGNNTEMNDNLAGAYFYAIKDDKKMCVFDKNKITHENKNHQIVPGQDFPYFEPTVDACNEYANLFYTKIKELDFKPGFVGKKAQNAATLTKEQLAAQRTSVSKYEDCSKCNFRTICRTTFSLAPKQLEK